MYIFKRIVEFYQLIIKIPWQEKGLLIMFLILGGMIFWFFLSTTKRPFILSEDIGVWKDRAEFVGLVLGPFIAVVAAYYVWKTLKVQENIRFTDSLLSSLNLLLLDLKSIESEVKEKSLTLNDFDFEFSILINNINSVKDMFDLRMESMISIDVAIAMQHHFTFANFRIYYFLTSVNCINVDQSAKKIKILEENWTPSPTLVKFFSDMISDDGYELTVDIT